MPPFWRAIGPWLPSGAGTDLNRSIVYFHGTDILRPLLVLSAWIAVGAALTLVASVIRPGSGRADLPKTEREAAAAAGDPAADPA